MIIEIVSELSTRRTRPEKQVRLRLNGFLGGLVAAFLFAFLFPSLGAKGGILHTETTGKVAIFLIFLIQGLALRTETLARGLLAWRVHLFIHAVMFVGIPMLMWLTLRLPLLHLEPALRTGFLLLSMLPTTISTAAVFTARAGGNITVAIFNSSISNVLGIFIVPLWIGWISHGNGQLIPVSSVLGEITVILLVPLVIGQIARPCIRSLVETNGSRLGAVTTALILFIVFAALSNSFVSRVWEGGGWATVLTALLGALVLLSVVTLLTAKLLRWTNFSREDRIAALFCASQKTLAAGIPLAQAIFANGPLPVGLIVLPIMAYHVSQLLLGAGLVEYLKRQSS